MEESKIRKHIGKVIVKVACKTASTEINTACPWYSYQPKLPANIEKFKKF